MDVQTAFDSLRQRIGRYVEEGDAGGLRSDEARAAAAVLSDAFPRIEADGLPLPVCTILATYHWLCFHADHRLTDAQQAVRLFHHLAEIDIDHVPPELHVLFRRNGPGDREPGQMLADGIRILQMIELVQAPDALDEAIRLLRALVAEHLDQLPMKTPALANLGMALLKRNAGIDDLDEAIRHLTAALELDEVEPEARAALRNNLAVVLNNRYRATGEMADLQVALQHCRAAVLEIDVASSVFPRLLGTIADLLLQRHAMLGGTDDLREAALWQRWGLGARDSDDLSQAGMYEALNRVCRVLYRHTGSIADLDEGIRAGLAALRCQPDGGGSDSCQILTGLAEAFRERHQATGDPTDLASAVGHYRHALKLAVGAYLTVMIMVGLATSLADRFARFGEPADLADALRLSESAMALSARADHELRSQALGARARIMRVHFEVTGDISVLDESIAILTAAIEAMKVISHRSEQEHASLGIALLARYGATRDIRDLDRAVEVASQAMDASDPQRTDTVITKSYVAEALRLRFLATGSAEDITRAVELLEEIVEELPPSFPGRAGYLVNLGVTLERRDLDASLAAFAGASGTRSAPASTRLIAESRAGEILMGADRPAEAAEAYRRAVELLSVAAWRGLGRRGGEAMLARWSHLASQAAAAHLEAAPRTAIQVLEQGRGVLWTQWLEMRGDHDLVRRRAPELGQRLLEIRSALDRLDQPVSPAR
ncbi:tetratricopeptide (TPR) repeat protein [Actinoplanes campanulatus]|uniref:Tetratricopeptide (TPR) repeat protein n=1 Tax=Actinoplanes campanulatus TaxID=113559 RepID=A0A7W5AH36_9ACTN|nr:hypothetical protein [Actinoplanes campanulatus]MBB3095946.1 tetratricopeptide (TPR) repeat protein [Actinoplanes campanulatus]GGN12608.1 hypothetical protein GCM10010109_23290 [Actinoplanes campanulatus]GID36959.1 hypothetical protein Aca09nite_34650 [Actinoplanes campanulatus]